MNLHHKVCIVTLSRYPDLFAGLDENLKEFAPGFDRVLVKDGFLIEASKGWCTVQGALGKFVYSKNANLGIRAVDPEADVFLIGDDVRLKVPQTIERLHEIAQSDPKVGLLSPRICGGADNVLQTDPTSSPVVYSERYLALVAVYIKRAVLNKIGYLDERYNAGWGWDDVDFSRRARLAGFSLAVTPTVEVKHGVQRKGSETFIRNEKGDSKAMQEQDDENAKIYFSKWNDNVK